VSLFAELRRRNVFRVAAAYVVTAWLVIQVVETILPAFGFGDTAVRYVTIAFAVGLIPVLVLSWVFEWTPEGLKREGEVDESAPASIKAARRLDRMILVVLAIALGYFAFDKFVLEAQRLTAERERQAQLLSEATEEARQAGRTEALIESYGDLSIAVLPFDDMSAEGDQEYMSDGIAEELLTLLARIPQLRVISRSSAFSFKGKDIEIPRIAERLNVAHILEGSVRKAEDRVRISVQLIDARSDTQLWSESYDRTLDDIFAIQEDIAATVAGQLKATLLTNPPKLEKTDPEAYALYLQARHLGRQFTAEGFEQSSALYRQALAIDPEYAPAWAGLTMNYNNLAMVGESPAEEAFALAKEAAGQALLVDPENALALSRLGFTIMVHDGDLAEAARHMEKALALDPSDPAVGGNAAVLLSILGRQEQAITLFELMTARDPINPVSYANLGLIYIYADRWDDAISALQSALRLSPGSIRAHFFIGEALLFKGDAEAALQSMELEASEVLNLLGLTLAQFALGRLEPSDEALADLIEKHGEDARFSIASAFAFRNEADDAFEWLEAAAKYGDQPLAFAPADPLFRNLHDDPRWMPYLEQIGMAPSELDTIEFEVTLPQQNSGSE
jgi:adenylate cyclase